MYIDQNAYRNPSYPLEPLFRSVYTENPGFDPSTLDLVTDRSNLRKLVWTICGNGIVEDFRIDIRLVGQTLLFTRYEEHTHERIGSNEFRGYGHSFERKFTTYGEGMKESTGHHRVIKYTMGSLQLLLRFEVDGYLSDVSTDYDPTTSQSNYSHNAVDDVQSLTSRLKNIDLDSTAQQCSTDQKVGLRVVHGGYKVPHSSLLELKTRSQRRPIQPSDVIYQLWFAQVPHLIAGYHNHGKFVRIEQKNFEENRAFQRFERARGSDLRKFVQVVEMIRTAMKGGKIDKAVLLFEDGSLDLYERMGTWDALPKDLISKWNDISSDS